MIEFGGFEGLESVENSEEGRWMTVLDPRIRAPLVNRGTEVQLLLLGVDSIAHQASMETVRKETDRLTSLYPDDTERAKARREIVLAHDVRITKGWRGVTLADTAEPLDCTPGNVMAMMRRYPFLADQADNWAGSRLNYFEKPRGASEQPPSPGPVDRAS